MRRKPRPRRRRTPRRTSRCTSAACATDLGVHPQAEPDQPVRRCARRGSDLWSAAMDSVIVGVLVLALVVRRQLQVRAVNDAGSALIPVALVAIGAAEVAAYADSHPPAAVTVATIAGSLV